MIVFDLVCSEGHRFEGWFGSGDEFTTQRDRRDIGCPTCGTPEIMKAPMAPAIPTKSNRGALQQAGEKSDDLPNKTPLAAKAANAVEALSAMQAEALKNSTYVGDSFAEDSRAMHYGEKDAAIIHGEASVHDAKELAKEGIAIAPLPFPVVKPDEIN
ncbi:hypothetical protein HME9302_01208 [Alteripontixanthobacter maritimus]|uniref:Uncharacterized protein n=1 Tax=Alteripontixanthobacter maritimus TaxID=2161824 RepID=A0A369QAR7_9SPHN|nr:DUF1178 family protein [Alteripontixanthobacter maritimus]RDC60009.1 hypothetical protein HME9302_01208 [Alteripontixanthobacter maritimus]